MSNKLIEAIKQLNDWQAREEKGKKKVNLLKKQIDIEALAGKKDEELKDIFVSKMETIIRLRPVRFYRLGNYFKEALPLNLRNLYFKLTGKAEEVIDADSENDSGDDIHGILAAGTGFPPDDDNQWQLDCPVCGKNIVDFSKKKDYFTDNLCAHVLLAAPYVYDYYQFSYVAKPMKEIADKLVKKCREENKGDLTLQMTEYADHSNGKYQVFCISNLEMSCGAIQEKNYFLIKMRA